MLTTSVSCTLGTAVYLAMLCRSILLVEETEVHTKTPDLPQVTDKLYHKMLFRVICCQNLWTLPLTTI